MHLYGRLVQFMSIDFTARVFPVVLSLSMSASFSVTPRIVVSRIAASLLGGYAFVWGFIAFGMSGLFALGMSFHDAEHLCAILGFLIYVIIFMWAFAARRLTKVWCILLGGGALMTVLGSLIQYQLT